MEIDLNNNSLYYRLIMIINYEYIDLKKYDKYTLKDIDLSYDCEYIIIDDIYNKKKIIDKSERYICINLDYFIDDIKKGFQNDFEIRKQFKVDLPRSHIYLNNIHIDCYNNFLFYLENTFDVKLINTILMLSTQALLALPLQILYTYLDENQYVAELKNKSHYVISIKIDKDGLIIINCSKMLRIIKLIDGIDITIYKVEINLEINILENGVLLHFKFNKDKIIKNKTY